MIDEVLLHTFRNGRTRRLTLTSRFQCQMRFLGASGNDGQVQVALHALGGRFLLHGGIDPAARDWATDYSGFGFTTSPPIRHVFRFQVKQPDDTWYQTDYGDGAPSAGRWLGSVAGVTPETMTVRGTFTCWVDTEDWKQMQIDARVPRTDYPIPYPSGGGASNVDWLGFSTLVYAEGPREGGEWGWELAIEDGTTTGNTGTFGAAGAGGDVLLHQTQIAVGAAQATYRANSTDVSGGWYYAKLAGESYGAGNIQLSDQYYAANSDGSSLHWFTSKAGVYVGVPADRFYFFDTTSKPPTLIRVRGRVVSGFEAQYDPTFGVTVSANWLPQLNRADYGTGTDGKLNDDWDLEEYLTTLELNTRASQQREIAALPHLRCWLRASWLNDRSEQPQDWRILPLDDTVFDPIRVKHLRRVTLDDLKSQADWSASGGTINPGTVLQVTTTSPGASVAKTYSPVLRSSEHRYLAFDAKVGSGSGTLTVSITSEDGLGYSYTHTLTDDWQEYTCDLCAPETATANTDTTDHAFIAPGEYFGPRRIESITFADLENGKTYSFREIEMARTQNATYTALPPNYQNGMEIDDCDDTIKRWRAMWGLSDRRQVMDLWYRQEHPTDPDLTGFLTLAEWLADLTELEGYETLTELTPPTATAREQFYGSTDRLAATLSDVFFLAGDGHPTNVVDKLIGAQLSGEPPAELAAQNVYCVHRFDGVMPFPGIGDPAGNFGGRFPFRFVKRLRQYVHGIVADPGEASGASGVELRLKRGAVVEQTAYSDSLGYYRLGPFRPLRTPQYVWTELLGDVAVPDLRTNRHFRRVDLRNEVTEPVVLSSLSAHVEPLSRREFVYGRGGDGKVYVYYVDRPTRDSMSITTKAISTAPAKFPHGVVEPTGHMRCVYTLDAGGNQQAESDDRWAAITRAALATPDVSGYDNWEAPVVESIGAHGAGYDTSSRRRHGSLYALVWGELTGQDVGKPLSIAVGSADREASPWTGWKGNEAAGATSGLPKQVFSVARGREGVMRVFYFTGDTAPFAVRSYVPVAQIEGWDAGPGDGGGWTLGGLNGESNVIATGSYKHPSAVYDRLTDTYYVVTWNTSGELEMWKLRLLSSILTEHSWSSQGPVAARTLVDVGDVPGAVEEQKVALLMNPQGELRMYWWDGDLKGCSLKTVM